MSVVFKSKAELGLHHAMQGSIQNLIRLEKPELRLCGRAGGGGVEEEV